MKRIAYLSDIHFGEQEDLRAWNFALKIMDSMMLDEIILGGDVQDHAAVGRYRKKPEVALSFQEELTHAFTELQRLREMFPSATMTYYRGNHEKRADNMLLDCAKPFYGINALHPQNLYRLSELDIQYIPETRPFKRGHLWVGHGDEFATGGVNPAHKALNDLNSNILFGHVHRFSTASKQQLNRRSIIAWSNGCLCRLDPNYVLNPDWVQGFSIIDLTDSGYFSVTPVVFWENPKYRCLQAVVEGKLFDSRLAK